MPRLELTVVRTVVVDVPETCPCCSADLCDNTCSPLREVSLRQHGFIGALEVDDGDAHLDVADAEGVAASNYMPVMYQCTFCNYVLAGDPQSFVDAESHAS